MSAFPKSARHPDVLQQGDYWRTVSNNINLDDQSQISEIPELAIEAQQLNSWAELEHSKLAAEIVGANAIRALAKCYESVDAFFHCDNNGISISAVSLAYNASYFSARAFCMLMGFCPMDRDSSITVDAFFQSKKGGKSSFTSQNTSLYKYRRWNHSEVWALTQRIVDTISVPEELVDIKRWLRSAKLDASSKLRNAIHYDDKQFVPTNKVTYIDIPDRISSSILDLNAPDKLSHQFQVTKHIIGLIQAVMSRGNLDMLLPNYVSNRRQTMI